MHPHCQRCVWDCRAQQSTWSFESGREGGVYSDYSLTFAHSNLGSYMDVTSWECWLPCHLWHILGSNLSKHSLLPNPFLFVSSLLLPTEKMLKASTTRPITAAGSQNRGLQVYDWSPWARTCLSQRLQTQSAHSISSSCSHRMQLSIVTHTFTVNESFMILRTYSSIACTIYKCAHATDMGLHMLAARVEKIYNLKQLQVTK